MQTELKARRRHNWGEWLKGLALVTFVTLFLLGRLDDSRWWPPVIATILAVGSTLSLIHAGNTGRITDGMGMASRNLRRQRFKVAVAQAWLVSTLAIILSIALWIRALTR